MTCNMDPDHVPRPPLDTRDWSDWLRWCVAVANEGTSELLWAAKLYPVTLSGVLTTRQAEVAQGIINEIYASYESGDLDVQQHYPAAEDPGSAQVIPFRKRRRTDAVL